MTLDEQDNMIDDVWEKMRLLLEDKGVFVSEIMAMRLLGQVLLQNLRGQALYSSLEEVKQDVTHKLCQSVIDNLYRVTEMASNGEIPCFNEAMKGVDLAPRVVKFKPFEGMENYSVGMVHLAMKEDNDE